MSPASKLMRKHQDHDDSKKITMEDVQVHPFKLRFLKTPQIKIETASSLGSRNYNSILKVIGEELDSNPTMSYME